MRHDAKAWHPPAGYQRNPARPVNAFGERKRKALCVVEHRKRTEVLNEELRLLDLQLHRRYMNGCW